MIGKGGAIIKALQEKSGAKTSIPSSAGMTSDDPAPVKIGLAGSKDAVAKAKGMIRSICMYYHCDATHPGLVHAEKVKNISRPPVQQPACVWIP